MEGFFGGIFCHRSSFGDLVMFATTSTTSARLSPFFSVLYSVGQITLGLLVHPYQTMQSLVEDRIFVWMSLLPTVVLALVTIAWRVAIVPGVRVVFSCADGGVLASACEWLPFFSNWLTFFCVYWQVLLLYLLLRFHLVLHR